MAALITTLSCLLAYVPSATVADPILPAMYANLSFLPPRTLHANWQNLTVHTDQGKFVGIYNDTYPNVRQFLRVPFAQPPIGDLRWMPPAKPLPSNKTIDSTHFGQVCPQWFSQTLDDWSRYDPDDDTQSIGESSNQGMSSWASGEDCLSLAIWTPAYANASSGLPVALFVTGGGGTHGSIIIPSQLPAQWVSSTQEHIVVTINYRVNIFGTPKARGLKERSLSLLDVRAAVEWVSEHIAAFGGDANNIMLWGQSQGAALTHLYTLAWPENPLVAKFGMISTPPSVTLNLTEEGDVYQDFDIVAKALGCNYGIDSQAELDCMRQVSWLQIEEWYNRYNGTPSTSFSNYIPDEKYIFSNESARYAAGKVAKGPAIRSDVAREQMNENSTITEEVEEQWVCTALDDSSARQKLGLETYRYYYGGNFSNISPVPYLGAFHTTDLPMIFGTYNISRGDPTIPISALEIETSRTMQDYLLAFLKNSTPTAMEASVGWRPFNANETHGGTMLEFGKEVPVKNITGDYLEAGCSISGIEFPIFD
ncbi:carboxylesterase, type B [Teratosphaeria nubilosa]|uniref:Carboxylesterase, type B n=1 Tax=Teratosphaeria nubilosa TaxID=161662 RepID=A0A6G1L5I3_9PEZI|nr:carboxylesterase, type B [Teratosphaeria nubilosa]